MKNNTQKTKKDWKQASIIDYIGNTPLVAIKKLNPNKNVNLIAKMEFLNPGGSIKDRAALNMIEEAERKGELTKDKIVVEATSGNTGIGLALVCAQKGYRLLLAMSESASEERKKILKAYGAQLVFTPASLGTDGAIEYVYGLVNQYPNRYHLIDQYNNEANYMAHYYTTANEIWEQTHGEVSAVVCCLGTSGTMMGLSKRLKELNPEIQVVAIEPYPNHKIQGLKNMQESYVPGIYSRSQADRIIHVDDENAFSMVHRLVGEEGLFVGMSSGAALAGAHQYVQELSKGTVVMIFPDGGERYLSTHLFTEPSEKKDQTQIQPLNATNIPSFYNTLSKTKEVIAPVERGKIKMYTCGPTVDGLLNIQQFRRFVVTDLLRRYLEYKEFQVTHVVNITDIDDQTIQGSFEQGVALKDYTQTYTEAFLADSDALNIKSASVYCKVTDHIDEMVGMTKRLMDMGLAYEKHRSIYFDVSRYRKYGVIFSGFDLNDMECSIFDDQDVCDAQEDPLDFTLFKRSTLNELKRGISYKTQWGNSRPGWHLSCAAMSMKHLGDNFDIYTCCNWHMFPHNANEIAIAEALSGKPLANHWLHVAPLFADGKAMRVGADNVITLRQLLDQNYSGRQVRFFLMSTNYREPVDFSYEQLDECCRKLDRLDRFVQQLFAIKPAQNPHKPSVLKPLIAELFEAFEAGMDDDLNIHTGLEALYHFVEEIMPLVERNELTIDDIEDLIFALDRIDLVLMILNFPREASEDENEFDLGWCYRFIEALRDQYQLNYA